MPHYLFRARYTQQGAQGVLKEGGSGRAEAVERLCSSVGGRAESQYWAFGDDDYILIAELPDNVAALAVSAAVATSGAGTVSTTVLLDAPEVDQLQQRQADYRPPGA